jgi:hypothetical protein
MLIVLSLVGACASVPKHASSDPVPVGEWCDQVGAAFCKATADRCFNGMNGVADGCRDTFKPSCLAGRAADGPSGRTGADLDHCVAALKPLTCEGLGAGIGSGSLGTVCSVR